MTYFPKSSTINNLYSNGELFNPKTRDPYVGYYYETHNGKYFAGRNPNELATQIELIIITSEESDLFQIQDLRFSTANNINYSILKEESQQLEKLQPFLNSVPTPTPQDYQIGEFQRYFAKKVNEEKYIVLSLS